MNCPICKLMMPLKSDGTQFGLGIESQCFVCDTQVKVSSNSGVKHVSWYKRRNSFIIQFYDFSYKICKNTNSIESIITIYDKHGIPTKNINIPEIDIFNISYEKIEQKIKNLIIFT